MSFGHRNSNKFIVSIVSLLLITITQFPKTVVADGTPCWDNCVNGICVGGFCQCRELWQGTNCTESFASAGENFKPIFETYISLTVIINLALFAGMLWESYRIIRRIKLSENGSQTALTGLIIMTIACLLRILYFSIDAHNWKSVFSIEFNAFLYWCPLNLLLMVGLLLFIYMESFQSFLVLDGYPPVLFAKAKGILYILLAFSLFVVFPILIWKAAKPGETATSFFNAVFGVTFTGTVFLALYFARRIKARLQQGLIDRFLNKMTNYVYVIGVTVLASVLTFGVFTVNSAQVWWFLFFQALMRTEEFIMIGFFLAILHLNPPPKSDLKHSESSTNLESGNSPQHLTSSGNNLGSGDHHFTFHNSTTPTNAQTSTGNSNLSTPNSTTKPKQPKSGRNSVVPLHDESGGGHHKMISSNSNLNPKLHKQLSEEKDLVLNDQLGNSTTTTILTNSGNSQYESSPMKKETFELLQRSPKTKKSVSFRNSDEQPEPQGENVPTTDVHFINTDENNNNNQQQTQTTHHKEHHKSKRISNSHHSHQQQQNVEQEVIETKRRHSKQVDNSNTNPTTTNITSTSSSSKSTPTPTTTSTHVKRKSQHVRTRSEEAEIEREREREREERDLSDHDVEQQELTPSVRRKGITDVIKAKGITVTDAIKSTSNAVTDAIKSSSNAVTDVIKSKLSLDSKSSNSNTNDDDDEDED